MHIFIIWILNSNFVKLEPTFTKVRAEVISVYTCSLKQLNDDRYNVMTILA